MTEYDVVIVGGGIIGASLALALKNSHRVLVLEANDPPLLNSTHASGERAIVLSAASQTILDTLGVWSAIAPFAAAVKKVHVSDRGHFGAVRLSADEEGVPALGYVVQAKYLDAQIAKAMQAVVSVCYKSTFVKIEDNHNDVTLTYSQNGEEISVKTNLVVAADGQNSALRTAVGIDAVTTVYEQSAIVSVIDLARSQNIAYERFTQDGPLAFLPLPDQQTALVWTVPAKDQDAIFKLSPEQFLATIQNKFGYRLGKFLSATPPAAFPIVMKRARELVKQHTVIIGNAANSIHPIAGQGLNLGLRDVAVLADLLQQKHANVLEEYVKRRQADHRDIVAITHNLVGIFSNAFLPLVIARSMGLVAMEILSPIKKWLSKRTMGYASFTTPLVCGVRDEYYE